MIYGNYAQCYEERVIDLWNTCCTFDAIDVGKFRRQAIFDDNFDQKLSWVAREGDNVLGFAFGTKRKFPYLERGLEPERGWVNVLFVDPSVRGTGVGVALLGRIEEELKARGATSITLGAYSPSYFFAGIDPVNYPEAVAFFEKQGYVAGDEHFSMGRDLHGYQVPQKTRERQAALEEQGYRFRLFDYSYSLDLLDFLYRELGAGWKRNALMSMQDGTAEDKQFLVINPSGRICGWCMRGIDDNPMRFGPIGIAKSERNNGLGSVLLDLYCFEMARRGIYHMYFITTDEPGRRYYARHGFEVIRTFVDYRKEMA